VPHSDRYYDSFPYIKYKSYKTSSNNRRLAEVENRPKDPVLIGLLALPSCYKQARDLSDVHLKLGCCAGQVRPIHNFLNPFTECAEGKLAGWWKT